MKSELKLTKVTRKGQVTIPEEIRKTYGITQGDYMLVHGAKGLVILKKLSVPTWDAILDYGERFARERNISTEQILKAVREIRRGR
jgi:AbrB family looped-hinge helix DNA binding protein